jgi:hypothetical protein
MILETPDGEMYIDEIKLITKVKKGVTKWIKKQIKS